MFPIIIPKTKDDIERENEIYSKNEFLLRFDGCSKGNPGLAGAGAVIYQYNKEVCSENWFIGDNYTNNHAEYTGLILGLKKAKELGIKSLRIEGDSLLVINQMTGLYKCKSDNMLSFYRTAKELETYFDKLEYVHILRNNNKRADALSNKAVDNYLKMNKK